MKSYSFLQKITTAIIISSLSLSCGATAKRETNQAQATNKPKPEPTIVYGDLIIKEQSDYLMIPVNLPGQDNDKESNSGYSRDYKRENLLYNIIFYHKQNGDAHLLLKKKAIINSFDFLETKTAGKVSTRLWLYKIFDQDTNGDKKLDYKDASIGYVSDLSGKNLQQITPNNTQLINWIIIPSQNAIFLKIIKDSDNDKKFTEADKTNFVRVSLDKPGMGIEIISDQIEQEIKSYLQK
ncbi:hypothetical protein Cylst_1452 [Cylindrospermum stagnale PCC 7417]|uniref:Lipoprotein n=1 Tax=Cylindrospermum stagnale PCC 7417 TaxID=56107 RepID=K9WVC5_9NOST|nr:hypothetical protein [Cylindrospermum stagnale]AFZ23736.1 hypothetical protein Cylst_1452 [Cylindrospermum stagnale PCC 7417]